MLNSGSPTFLLFIETPWFRTFHEENAWEIKHLMQIVKMYNWMSIGSTVNLASSCPWRGGRQIGGVWARLENEEVGRATVASLMKSLEEKKKKKLEEGGFLRTLEHASGLRGKGWEAEAKGSAKGRDWWGQVSEGQEDLDSRTYVP